MSARAILIVGYGNELRGDDGLGPRLAREIRALNLPDVHCVEAHQLLPELALDLAAHDAVLFVDAIQVDADAPVQKIPLTPLTPAVAFTGPHVSDPAGLLALTRDLYQKCPTAWLVAIPGTQFNFSDSLSPQAEKAVGQAVDAVKALIATLR
jgi:hydrogenase maturation protease